MEVFDRLCRFAVTDGTVVVAEQLGQVIWRPANACGANIGCRQLGQLKFIEVEAASIRRNKNRAANFRQFWLS